jgi:thiol-disulfide isomerase/thioredoxin
VGEQLADGDLLFPMLRELGPVPGHWLFVIEPAARVGKRERHSGQTLRGRVHHHHGVLLPGLTGVLVSNAAPQVNDLLATLIGTAGAAQFTPPNEVLYESLAYCLEATADVPLNTQAVRGYRMSLESQGRYWEQSFFLRNAELGKAENRKQDALAYYASALRTAHRINTDYARNRVLPHAAALWRELGGTQEGWQQWLDQAGLPAPTDAPKPEMPKTPAWTKVDRPFPAFRVPDLDGRNRTLDDLKGTVTFVNVWATWCEPCRAELPALQKLHDRLKESGAARVVTLNMDWSTGLVGPFVAERKFGFPVWLAQPLFDD